VSIADVERENVAWLWFPYIPKGKLTIMEGDPGIGKSFITMALAADLSQGRPLWGQDRVAGAKQKVLLLSAEDGLGDTIRPRLEAMSADLHQIVAFN
jgi:RecA-family ATPase